MNDKQLAPLVSSWLKQGNRPPSDPTASIRTAMDAATRTSQLDRWWLPFFTHRRRIPPSRPNATNHTPDSQPSPTPATNGHTPTVSGRTTSMLSPAKAITAGAIVFAIGGVMLIAQPFAQQGGNSPAATVEEPQPAMSEFTGRLGCGSAGPSSGAVSWQFPVVEVSDKRFDGTYLNQLAGYEDGDPDIDGVGAYSSLWEIMTEDGGWVGDTASFRFPPDSYSTFTVKLEGQDAYAGLTAIMEGDFTEDCGFDIRGVVVDGDLPATPQSVMATG